MPEQENSVHIYRIDDFQVVNPYAIPVAGC